MQCDIKMKRLMELKAAGKEETKEYKELFYCLYWNAEERKHLNTAGCP